jgi:hypothetical protein
MSETENTSDTTIDVTVEQDNLDNFAAEFFGESPKPSDNAKSEEAQDDSKTGNDAPTEEEDTHSAEDGATEDSEESEEETETDESDDDDKPSKKGGNRFQERINEVVAKQRQAERERDELKRQLEELKAKPSEPEKAKPANTNTPTENEVTGPSPTDKNEDGTDKYPLGEFDPKFVKDVIQHTLDQELKARQEQQARQEKCQQKRHKRLRSLLLPNQVHHQFRQ